MYVEFKKKMISGKLGGVDVRLPYGPLCDPGKVSDPLCACTTGSDEMEHVGK